MNKFKTGKPIILKGSSFERGVLQAELCPEMIDSVRENILSQVNKYKDLLKSDRNKAYLKAQTNLTQKYVPDIFDEIKGIAKGFELGIDDLFKFYHLRIIRDIDGCTTWAVSLSGEGAVVGKNRDQAAGSHALQRVFIHQDPAWQQNKILSVGSLGAPCAYSSGINAHGFCLADTNILTSDHGPGICRYFLMPFLLVTCKSTDDALKMITDLPHAGGGSLTLGDKYGNITIVELGHTSVDIQTQPSWLVKTNHFDSDQLNSSNIISGRQSNIKNSMDRLRFIKSRIKDVHQKFSLEKAIDLERSHGGDDEVGICRHIEQDTLSTISGVIYTCGDNLLYFSDGNPCLASWYKFSLESNPLNKCEKT
ncbi:MAG: C45 family peptidase [Desulfobacterales bacterium]|nr:C45 family peptidase [Desulfobacterales bacterium]